MRIKKRQIILTLILCLFAGLLVQCVNSREPTTERLIQQLEENEGQYVTLVEMISVDTNISTIGPGYEFSVDHFFTDATTSDLGITDERLQEYRERLEAIGVKLLCRNYEGDVHFGIWGSGFGGNTHHKGISWIPESSSSTTNTPYQLIKIKDGWYIYED
jgi:hypothetical protein